MVSLDVAYAETKATLLADLRMAGDSCWLQAVPATPDWRVGDVIAHVTGIAADAAHGTVPADLNLLEQFRDGSVVSARDAYAESHVQTRHDLPPVDVVAEWNAVEPEVLSRLGPECQSDQKLPNGFDVVLVIDLCVHADDVAGALGLLPHRDSGASGIALAGYCFGLDYRIRALGLPALKVRYEGSERLVGRGPAAATVTGDRWELLRVFAGRRSRSQIRALDWDGDPDPYLAWLPAYGERDDALFEAGGTSGAPR